MKNVIITIIIVGLISVIVHSFIAQKRLEDEIEQLRIQIQEMHKPISPALLDAKTQGSPKIEKSSITLDRFM